MNKKEETIVINKLIAKPTLHLSKKQAKAIKWMKRRFIKDGLLTDLEDLNQFVRSRSSQGSKTAVRKFAQRLVDSSAVERLEDGIFVPAGHRNLVKDIDIKTLAKIKSKRERNSIVKAQHQFLSFAQPIVANKQNKWCLPLTQPTIKFKVDGLYEKLYELNQIKKPNKYFRIPVVDERIPHLKAEFNLYPQKVILKIGNGDLPIHANESIIFSALFICRNYLISINKFCNWNLEITSAHEWLINIPSTYCITINPDYLKFGDRIKDDSLGFELTDNGKYLLLKQNLSLIQLKPSQLVGFNTYLNPLKILDLEPLKTFQNQSQNVTHLKPIFERERVIIEKQAQNVTDLQEYWKTPEIRGEILK